MKIADFDNTYAALGESFCQKVKPAHFPHPSLICLNENLAYKLGLNLSNLNDQQLASLFTGQLLADGSSPIAQVYAAHQFGHFVPQLGDGRAMMLGEVIDRNGVRRDIQLKGCGQTAFSRNGDGRSWIGPVLREYLVSESMYSLGIPTTRALACCMTGEQVYREAPLPGGIFTRVATSHLRIGTFQYFTAREDWCNLEKLISYTIDRHYPEVKKSDSPYVDFFKKVAQKIMTMVSAWMGVGFIHGVMNTDNMSIVGETIDYGPCAFMDHFKMNKVFSSIDRQGRYAYANQMTIALWNLARFADCLIHVSAEESRNNLMGQLNELLSKCSVDLQKMVDEVFAQKLGFSQVNDSVKKLTLEFLELMENENLDFTLSFRLLADHLDGPCHPGLGEVKTSSRLNDFINRWKNSLLDHKCDFKQAQKQMLSTNPIFIARNHMIEKIIDNAVHGDISGFHQFRKVLEKPYQYDEAFVEYAKAPKPTERVYQTFCGT